MTKHKWTIGISLGFALLISAALVLILSGEEADAASRKCNPRVNWCGTEASWYGPGFYGNRFACAGRPGLPTNYHRRTRGVAHRTLPCGTRLSICYRVPRRPHQLNCTQVRVIDRGPFVRGRDLDLTARSAMDLCRCSRPFTMKVIYNA